MKNETVHSLASAGEWKESRGLEQDKKAATSKKLGWLGVGLCGLACSLPFVGAIIGISFFSAIAVYLETFAILVLGLAVAIFAFAYYQKKKKASDKHDGASCAVDGSCGCGSKSGPEKIEKAKKSAS